METDNADGNQVPDGGNELPNIAGLRIYVRRLRDVRSVEERRYSVITSMGGNERLPIRDYVIQPEAGADWTRPHPGDRTGGAHRHSHQRSQHRASLFSTP